MISFIKFCLLALIALLGITFACLNAQPVDLNFYIGNAIISLPLLLAITLISGSLLGILATLSLYFSQKTENLRLQHRLKLAEKEVTNLRTLPLKELE